MKKQIAILFLVFTIYSCGCKKDAANPEDIQMGIWSSSKPVLQFTIRNLKGEGNFVNYLEYSENGKRFLKVNHELGPDVYLIKSVWFRTMTLVDTKDSTNTDISMIRKD